METPPLCLYCRKRSDVSVPCDLKRNDRSASQTCKSRSCDGREVTVQNVGACERRRLNRHGGLSLRSASPSSQMYLLDCTISPLSLPQVCLCLLVPVHGWVA